MDRLTRAAAAVQKAESTLAAARRERDAAMRAAVDAGVSQAAMARALGVSRQRVAELLKRDT